MPYSLGNKTFKTKKTIIEYFQKYHNSNDIGTILDEEHHNVMRDLIKWHPEYDEWNISDTSNIKFKINIDDYKNKFYEIWNNDKWIFYSYLKCIKSDNKKKNHEINCLNAFRVAIKPQIDKFKEDNKILTEIDDIEGIPIYKNQWLCISCLETFDSIDIDHKYDELSFKKLVQDFLIYTNKDYKDFKMTSHIASGHTLSKKDSNIWETYHKENAILRCLCRICHQHKKK